MLEIETPETLRTWIGRSEVDSGVTPSQMAEENKALRRRSPSCAAPMRY